MILVDTSVWIDHLHRRDTALADLLEDGMVATHPLVVGELALGSVKDRQTLMRLLRNLPQTTPATHDEVLHLVDNHRLHGLGLGVVDAHLLASLLLTPAARLWTRDRRLRAVAERFDVAETTVS